MKKTKENFITLIFNTFPINKDLSGDTSYYSQLINHIPNYCIAYIFDLKSKNIYQYKDKNLNIYKTQFKGKKIYARLTLLLKFLFFLRSIRSFLSLKYYFLMFLTSFKFPELFINKKHSLIIFQHWYLASSLKLFSNNKDVFRIAQTHVPDHKVYQAAKFENKHKQIKLNRSLKNLFLSFNLENDYKYSISVADRVSYFNKGDIKYDIKYSYSRYFEQTTSVTLSPFNLEKFKSLKANIDNPKNIRAFFLGNMFWPPNYHALSSHVQILNLYKLLTNKEIIIDIFGNYDKKLSLLYPDLNFKGFCKNLENLSDYDYFINPVRIGGGIRTKNEFILSNTNTNTKLLVHSKCKDNLVEDEKIMFFYDSLSCVQKIISSTYKIEYKNIPLKFFPFYDGIV